MSVFNDCRRIYYVVISDRYCYMFIKLVEKKKIDFVIQNEGSDIVSNQLLHPYKYILVT